MTLAYALAALPLAFAQNFGPSQEMFDELKNAPDEQTAAPIADDIRAAWQESGSAAADLVMTRAVEAHEAGQDELAYSLYDRVIAIQPGYAEAWNRRAVLFLADGKLGEALRDVNEAIRLEPRHFGAWAGIGSVFESLGALEPALEAYEQALRIHPNYAPALKGRDRIEDKSAGETI